MKGIYKHIYTKKLQKLYKKHNFNKKEVDKIDKMLYIMKQNIRGN
jgi:hypothetical protein